MTLKKDKVYPLRLTSAERDDLDARARAAGLGTADYVRTRIFPHSPTEEEKRQCVKCESPMTLPRFAQGKRLCVRCDT